MDEAPLMTIHFIFGQEEMRITNHAKFLSQESNDPCHNNCQPFTMVDDGGGDGGVEEGGGVVVVMVGMVVIFHIEMAKLEM